MNRDPVVSSNVMSVGHDPATRAVEVAFRPNRGVSKVYRYADVDAVDVTELLEAESIGKAFATFKARHMGVLIATIEEGVETRLDEDIAS